jgi:hypothetical protein
VPKGNPEREALPHRRQCGLSLLITAKGGKLWRWKYRSEGKQKQMAIGKYPDISLADARLHHAQARQLLANGTDPMVVRKEVKERKKVKEGAQVEQPVGLTFADMTRKWFDWWKKDKDAGYVEDVGTRMENDIIAKLGTKLPAEITRMEVVRLIQEVEERGAHDVARRNLQVIRQI